jgi:ATP-binding cassette subfamily F protein 3
MSNLLQLQAGVKSYGTKILFDEAQFAINESEHVGVIGPNGAGKTTLFKILTGDESLDSGILVKSKSLQLGYLAQHDNWSAGETVEDYLTNGCKTPIWELKSLSQDLGISEELFSKPITSLSGGYRMRCKLLYLIGQEPSLMLLDEPTNYLDLETTLVLEKFLQGYKGAFLLISHDREFLRRTTDHVLEIEQGEITKYNGNLDDYFEQKELLRSQLEARALSLKEKRDEVLQFVARFGAKATKAKQAQSRLKSLDRMEVIELKELAVSARIKLPPPTKTGKVIATLEEVSLGYGDKPVLHNVNFNLINGDHIAVVGLNGAGKSTFLKSIAQSLEPTKGTIEFGFGVSIGYYAQHVAESLNANSCVIDEIVAKAHKDVTRQEALGMAGSLLFSGNDLQKRISVLSGGEKSRVALGQILLQKAPCLVLDEPTNHLDFQTVEALTQALTKYEGTLVVVSHDRSFIRRIGTRVLEINHGRVIVYPGTYDEYVWSLQKGMLSERNISYDISSPKKVEAQRNSNSNYKDEKKNLDRTLKTCEKNISKLDNDLKSLNENLLELNEKISKQAGFDLLKSIQELTDVQKKISELESQWLTENEKKENATKSLERLKS